jgi:hypothetical protein
MTPVAELAARLRTAFPGAQLELSEPVAPGAVGFLDIAHGGNVLAVQWQEQWHFGISSPEGHGYGEKPDEVCGTVEEAFARIVDLVRSGKKTQPPLEVTLRELRAERNLPQTKLAALLGVSQPAVSRLERRVSRLLVASLRAVVQAMGGDLVIQARFPDGVVRQIALDEDSGCRPEQEEITADV